MADFWQIIKSNSAIVHGVCLAFELQGSSSTPCVPSVLPACCRMIFLFLSWADPRWVWPGGRPNRYQPQQSQDLCLRSEIWKKRPFRHTKRWFSKKFEPKMYFINGKGKRACTWRKVELTNCTEAETPPGQNFWTSDSARTEIPVNCLPKDRITAIRLHKDRIISRVTPQ